MNRFCKYRVWNLFMQTFCWVANGKDQLLSKIWIGKKRRIR